MWFSGFCGKRGYILVKNAKKRLERGLTGTDKFCIFAVENKRLFIKIGLNWGYSYITKVLVDKKWRVLCQ